MSCHVMSCHVMSCHVMLVIIIFFVNWHCMKLFLTKKCYYEKKNSKGDSLHTKKNSRGDIISKNYSGKQKMDPIFVSIEFDH